jgi:hypothetical protein
MADFAKQRDANVTDDPAQTAATLSLAAKCLGISVFIGLFWGANC